ncbi:dTDP-4-dehydrorhamnose reductase [Cellulomonas endophytica]|uniref:dTDP-4-dehydrorhamnose reductase n=1 Tax=Cellulomonas endophytica TaxID=2494735 RepID=UPI0010117738|nr:dTDP-4-dehydrorhamnose reductase [Cellulomonas endophytica]
MRWLVVGGNGMLGTDLRAALVRAGEDVVAPDRRALDVTDAAAVRSAVQDVDLVVNCAAFTAVDAAETEEPAAFAVNATAPALLARAAAAAGARLVHVSTDYVFAGDGTRPYDEDDDVAPRSAYGRTKAAGEWAVLAASRDHLVVRTAWLYGAHGPCFPRTIARVARERGAVSVVDDQVGQPTWTVDLADLVLRLVAARAPGGVYHGTATGAVSWFGFARAVVAAAGLDPETVSPTTSADFARPAPRPAYSVLGHGRLEAAGVAPVGRWAERWAAAAPSVLAG